MKKISNELKLYVHFLYFLSIALFVSSCENNITPSLYSDDVETGISAEITNVNPTQGYAGVTKILIGGNNFSENPNDNYVYFNSVKANVVSASVNELEIVAPVIIGDSLQLKIGKRGVEKWSNTIIYKLENAVREVYPFLANQEPYSVTTDKQGNLYFSFIESAKGLGVWKLTPNGTLSEFAPKGGETTFFDLKYHSNGYLIGVYGNKAIFKIEEGVKPAVFANTGDNSIKLQALDIDKDSTIWAAGKGGIIVGVKPDKSFKFFNYESDINAVRVFENFLYVISGELNNQDIFRIPIVSADSLGEPELYFSFSSNVEEDVVANALTFSAEGQMFIGISPSLNNDNPVDPIIYVNRDGSFGTWYAGLIESRITSISWSIGTEIFIVRSRYPSDRALDPIFNQTILAVDMERLGAPEFGRD